MPVEISPALLESALARTLEDAAFTVCERTEDPPPIEEPMLEARLRYAGDHDGELRLAVPETFASALAASMLGEEEGGAAVTGDDEDAVGELLNIMAGAIALEIFGRYGRCALGVPRVSRVSPSANERALSTADSVAILVDDEGRRIDVSAVRIPGEWR